VRKAGLSVAVQPAMYTIPAFTDAILAHYAEKKR
jgi:hypothetical protein